VEDYEGCLSVPNIYGKVPRYNKVKIRALNINGKVFRTSVEGFLARIFQHEIDHVNGKVFIDHIRDDKDAFFVLKSDGKLEQINYEDRVENNSILW
jgi:peptide deformylase